MNEDIVRFVTLTYKYLLIYVQFNFLEKIMGNKKITVNDTNCSYLFFCHKILNTCLLGNKDIGKIY